VNIRLLISALIAALLFSSYFFYKNEYGREPDLCPMELRSSLISIQNKEGGELEEYYISIGDMLFRDENIDCVNQMSDLANHSLKNFVVMLPTMYIDNFCMSLKEMERRVRMIESNRVFGSRGNEIISDVMPDIEKYSQFCKSEIKKE
jgi:hypothetical protein